MGPSFAEAVAATWVGWGLGGGGCERCVCWGSGQPWGVNVKTRDLMNAEATQWDKRRKQCQTVLGGGSR